MIRRLRCRSAGRSRCASSAAGDLLGMAIDGDAIANAFDRIGFDFREDGDTFVVTPPSFRFDLEIEEDLIGEVARLTGYDNIPAHPPRTAATMRAEPEERRSAHDIRRALSLAGLHGADQLFVRRCAVGARLCGQPRSDRGAQSDREPDVGHAKYVAGRAGRTRSLTT